jgi:hypothetical protein
MAVGRLLFNLTLVSIATGVLKPEPYKASIIEFFMLDLDNGFTLFATARAI